MKKYILVLLYTYSSFLMGQTPCGDVSENWHLEKGNSFIILDYQLSDNDSIPDDTTITMDKALYFFNMQKEVENIEQSGNTIEFNVLRANGNYEKYGFKFADITIKFPISFHCKIIVGSGNYQVLFSKILLNTEFNNHVVLDDDYFNKNGCIKKSNKSYIQNNLALLRLFFVDFCSIELSNTLPKRTEPSDANSLNTLEPNSLPDRKDNLINNAGQCMKKSLDNTIGGGVLGILGSSCLSYGVFSNSSELKVVGGVSLVGSLVCGIAAISWQYKAANCLIKIAPNAVRINF